MSVVTRLCRGAGLLKWSRPLISRVGTRGVGNTSTAQQADEDILRNAQKQNQQTRIDLATSYRAMEYYNLHMGVCNHLTALCPAANGEGTVMLLVPHGTHWSQVTASCLLGLNEKGEVVEGTGRAETSAAEIHMAVYDAREDVKSVMHTHSPYATALGTLKDCTFRMIQQESVRFYNNIAYDTEYDGFATSGEEGPRLASKLGDKTALMMCNHGVLTVGQTVALAFDYMYYLERGAMYQMMAMQTGRELREIQPHVVTKWVEEALEYIVPYAELHLQSFKDIMAKKSPETLQ
ncbi:ADD1 [Branchiostoma lanceolatum]|uniref:ADD1 protein n=1 Tax=Branchiostoma lanceolatum TaxID=7740 RepID=A0A8K0A6H9_BRALA|nr:ADD1 [Branchiostoma lanceolatum]